MASKTKDIIKRYEFNFKKNFGQNFLVDERVLEKIINAADINSDDVVIEIGPGIGTLTAAIAKCAFKVISVEIDSCLIPILKDVLSDYNNIEIINTDILKFNISDVLEKYKDKNVKIVANLPYYISTSVIMDILEKRLSIKSITVMVQKEVAYRMQAAPSSKDYGSLSLAVQYYSKPYLAANVPQNCFIPRPNIDSAVIKLDILEYPSVNTIDEKLMFKVIKSAFSQRRKTLLNCLYNTGGFELSKDNIIYIIKLAGFDENIRGEKLSISDFAHLTDILYRFINKTL